MLSADTRDKNLLRTLLVHRLDEQEFGGVHGGEVSRRVAAVERCPRRARALSERSGAGLTERKHFARFELPHPGQEPPFGDCFFFGPGNLGALENFCQALSGD